MSQDNLNPGKYGENSSHLADQSEAHERGASTIPDTPHEAPLEVTIQEANSIATDGPHYSKSRQKARIVSEISRSRAYFEITVITIGVIGLLWTGTVLLYYIAGGMVAFLGFLVSTIISLSTFIGIFWPVFLKNVWNFLRNRHSKRWRLFGRVLAGSFVIAVLLFLGIVRWQFDPYHHLAWPALSDQLSSNDDYWHSETGGDQTDGECKFDKGSYHVTANSGSLYFCVATVTDYANFIYEVQMTFKITSPPQSPQYYCGGLVFRADYANNKEYYFEICYDGSYCLYLYNSSNWQPLLGCYAGYNTGNLPQILKDTSVITQPITLAVVAKGNHFEFWVNYKELDVGFDGSLSMVV